MKTLPLCSSTERRSATFSRDRSSFLVAGGEREREREVAAGGWRAFETTETVIIGG